MPEEMILTPNNAVLVRPGSFEVRGDHVYPVEDRPEPRSLAERIAALEAKIEKENNE